MHQPLFDLYVACCTANGGVAHVVLYDDGSLMRAESVSAPSPLYLLLENRRLHTLLCDPFENGESGYATFALGADGTVGERETLLSTGGGEACHLSLFDGYAVVANYQTGSVARLSPTGERLLRVHQSCKRDSEQQGTPHTHCVLPTPDGRLLLCTDLGTDTVLTYDGELNVLFTANTPTGSGPRHLVFSPDGQFVYCVNEPGNTITVFSYENGQLTPLKTVDALPFDHGESYAAAIRLTDGKLYVSHRGDDSITVFSAEGERLTFEERISCGGRWPRDFDIFGNYLVCTNEKSDTVTVLRKTAKQWETCSALSLPRPLCVVGRPKKKR